MVGYKIHAAAQLSAHLRSLRKSRGLTQAQLGAMLGVDQTRIAKIERNPGLISVDQLLQLLAALNVEVELQPRTAASRPATEPTTDW